MHFLCLIITWGLPRSIFVIRELHLQDYLVSIFLTKMLLVPLKNNSWYSSIVSNYVVCYNEVINKPLVDFRRKSNIVLVQILHVFILYLKRNQVNARINTHQSRLSSNFEIKISHTVILILCRRWEGLPKIWDALRKLNQCFFSLSLYRKMVSPQRKSAVLLQDKRQGLYASVTYWPN